MKKYLSILALVASFLFLSEAAWAKINSYTFTMGATNAGKPPTVDIKTKTTFDDGTPPRTSNFKKTITQACYDHLQNAENKAAIQSAINTAISKASTGNDLVKKSHNVLDKGCPPPTPGGGYLD